MGSIPLQTHGHGIVTEIVTRTMCACDSEVFTVKEVALS